MDRLPLTDELAALLNQALRLNKFFPQFSRKDLESALVESALYLYPKGAAVITQGQEGRDLFVIFKGSAAVYREDNAERRQVGTLVAGDVFGEMALIGDGLRRASVITEEPSSIFRLTYSDIAYHLKRTPELGAHLQSISQRRLAA